MPPARTPAQMQLQYAQTFGAIKALEDMARRQRDQAAASREQWPELWSKLDRLFRLLHD